MAVPTGPASLADIQTEFTGSNPISLTEYYAGGGLVTNPPPTSIHQTGPVPTSGTISIGNFLGLTSVPPAHVVTPLINRTWSEYYQFAGAGTALTWLYFTADGLIYCMRGESPGGEANVVMYQDNWYTPQTPGIGNNFYIRATLLSGSAPNSNSDPINQWIQIVGGVNGSISWNNNATTTSSSATLTRTMRLRIDIATDAFGSNIVTSGIYQTTATKEGNA